MKRAIAFIVIILLCIVYPAPVFAADGFDSYFSLEGSEDYAVITGMEEKILKELKETYELFYKEKAAEVPTKVDYSAAYKVYVDTGIQDLDSASEQDISALLDSSDYVWVVPFVVAGENVKVTIGKGMPLRSEAASVLTPQEQAMVRANEGKWKINGVSVQTGEPLLSQVADMDLQNLYDKVIFIGGIPGLRLPIALGLQDGEAAAWVPFDYMYSVIEDDVAPRSRSNGYYGYQCILDACKQYDQPSDQDGGGGGLPVSEPADGKNEYTALCTVGMLFAAAVLLLVWKRRQRINGSALK